MADLTPFSECLLTKGQFEYLTILYSTPEDIYEAYNLIEWESKLSELEEIMRDRGLKVKVCAVDVMEDPIPDVLVRSPFKSFMTKEHRRE
jgi:hypothetical protein